jgi:uncharacterized membrane protein
MARAKKRRLNMLGPFIQISSAFGLSSAAGLNAYIPLLLLSIMANRGMIHLAPEFSAFSSPWTVALLAALCLIELVVDKIPGADHVNDVIQTFLRPTAGALLFAAQTGTITHIHPGVFIVLGLLTAGSVHAAKAVARPVVNVATFGIGAPVVSTLEDLVSTILSLVALEVPILSLVLMIFFAWFLYRAFRRFASKSRPIKVNARPVPEPSAALAAAGSAPSTWRGGL